MSRYKYCFGVNFVKYLHKSCLLPVLYHPVPCHNYSQTANGLRKIEVGSIFRRQKRDWRHHRVVVLVHNNNGGEAAARRRHAKPNHINDDVDKESERRRRWWRRDSQAWTVIDNRLRGWVIFCENVQQIQWLANMLFRGCVIRPHTQRRVTQTFLGE